MLIVWVLNILGTNMYPFGVNNVERCTIWKGTATVISVKSFSNFFSKAFFLERESVDNYHSFYR